MTSLDLPTPRPPISPKASPADTVDSAWITNSGVGLFSPGQSCAMQASCHRASVFIGNHDYQSAISHLEVLVETLKRIDRP